MDDKQKAEQLLVYFRKYSEGVPVEYQQDFKTLNFYYQFDRGTFLAFIIITKEFLEDHEYDEIIEVIETKDLLKQVMQSRKPISIRLMNQGIRIESQ